MAMFEIFPPLSGSLVVAFTAGPVTEVEINVRGSVPAGGKANLVFSDKYTLVLSRAINGVTDVAVWPNGSTPANPVVMGHDFDSVRITDDVVFGAAALAPGVGWSEIERPCFLGNVPETNPALVSWTKGSSSVPIDNNDLPDWGKANASTIIDLSTDVVEQEDPDLIEINYRVHDGTMWRRVGIQHPLEKSLDLGNNRIHNVKNPHDPQDAATLSSVDKTVGDVDRHLKSIVSQMQSQIDELRNQQAALESGVSHGVNVNSIADSPPPENQLVDGDAYIVSNNSATGIADWDSNINNLAFWINGDWEYYPPEKGDAHFVEDVSAQYSWNGTAWVKISGVQSQPDLGVVGEIKITGMSEAQFKSACGPTEAVKWVPADGRAVAGTEYEKITGSSTVPDLRGAYFRGAGRNTSHTKPNGWHWDGGAVNNFTNDMTAKPNSAFTTDTQGAHNHSIQNAGSHTHNLKVRNGGDVWGHEQYTSGLIGMKSGDRNFSIDGSVWTIYTSNFLFSSGDHTHTVNLGGNHSHSINGGGDNETRPVTYSVNYFIKVDK